MPNRSVLLLLFLVSWFSLNSFLAVGQSIADLEKELSLAKEDTARLQILTDLNWAYLPVSLSKSREIALQEIELAEKNNLPKWIAQGYNDLGIVQQKEMQFHRALRSHSQALLIREKLRNPYDIGSTLSKMGLCYSELDSLDKALSYQLKALIQFRKSGNKKAIATTLNNVAFVFQELSQFDQIEKYLTEAIQINNELGDPFAAAACLNLLANTDEQKGDYDAALSKFKAALRMIIPLKDSVSIASYLNNIALMYSRKNDLKQAYFNYAKALSMVNKATDINGVILYQSNLASILVRQKKNREAEVRIREAQSLAESGKFTLALPQIYATLGALFTEMCVIDSANKYYHLYAQAIRTDFSGKMAKQLSSLQIQYEIDIREQEKKILNQEIELKAGSLARFHWLTTALVLGIALLVLAFLFFRNRQILLRRQQLNAERSAQLEIRSKAVIEAEERERNRIARELHDGLGQQLSAAKMNMDSLKMRLTSVDQSQSILFENVVSLLDDAVKEVRSVSHDMMANSLIKNGLASAVRDFVHKMGEQDSLKIDLEIIGLKDRLDSAMEMMLYRVLQELINNIIRHAKATMVSIQLIRHESTLLLQVEDDGIGFKFEKQNLTDGIGLSNIHSRVEFLHGTLEIDSQPGHGTTVIVEVPI